LLASVQLDTAIIPPHPIYFFIIFYTFKISLHFFFFFNDTATTEIYTLSLHDALPIWNAKSGKSFGYWRDGWRINFLKGVGGFERSEEHTSELQSRGHLVCRLLLEKKKKENEKKRKEHVSH